jgi:hypothetical protein
MVTKLKKDCTKKYYVCINKRHKQAYNKKQ